MVVPRILGQMKEPCIFGLKSLQEWPAAQKKIRNFAPVAGASVVFGASAQLRQPPPVGKYPWPSGLTH